MRNTDFDDPDDPDDPDDDDGGGDDFEDDSDDGTTIPCPACGHEIFDDTPRCPSCGHFLTAAELAGGRRPAWIVATALLCLAVALWWALTR